MRRVSLKKTGIQSVEISGAFKKYIYIYISILWWGSRIGSQLAFCVSVKVGGSA